MQNLYNNSSDFKDYVDKFAAIKNLPVSEILEFQTTKDVAEYYKEKEKKNAHSRNNMGSI